MAIAYDATSHFELTAGSANPLTMAHTVTGSNNTIVLIINAVGAAADPTGVTWGAQNFTKVDSLTSFGFSSSWILAGATAGAGNIVATFAAGVSTPAFMTASSYTGTSASQPDSHNTGVITSGTTLTINTTVVASNCWLVGGAMAISGTPVTFTSWNSNKTDRQNRVQIFGGGVTYRWTQTDTNGTVGTGSQGITWTANVGYMIAADGPGFLVSIAPTGGVVDNSLFFAGN